MRASSTVRKRAPTPSAAEEVAAIIGSRLAVHAIVGGRWALRRQYLGRGDYRLPVTLAEFRDRRLAVSAAQHQRLLDRQVLEASGANNL